MKSIRIIVTPPGPAPEFVRAHWVGVLIPLATEDEIAQDPPSGFSIGSENISGYLVLRAKAIKALGDMDREDAANYWSQLLCGRYLRFKKEACELVA